MLKSSIHAAAGHVMGSNASKFHFKSQIWSMSISIGPPSLWVTTNPDDLHDPIMQVFTQEQINLDDFLGSLGSELHWRAQNVAQDLYTSAKYFHFMIQTILSTLFGAEWTTYRLLSKKGLFGHLSVYLGVVESQEHGTLHLHIILWLWKTPSLSRMHKLLKTEEFHMKVKEFIKVNIQAYLPDLETQNSVKAIWMRLRLDILILQTHSTQMINIKQNLMNISDRLHMPSKFIFASSEDASELMGMESWCANIVLKHTKTK